MIGYLRGRLARKSPEGLVVDVGGVGYVVQVSLSTYADLPGEGRDVELHVHTQVREDALNLFGFLTEDERSVFVRLIGVAGVGPKVALAVLSGVRPDALRGAVAAGDARGLVRIPGIGKKIAERIVLELRDKLGPPGSVDSLPGAAPLGLAASDVASALVNLGYRKGDAEAVVFAAAKELGEDAPFDALLRRALGRLAK